MGEPTGEPNPQRQAGGACAKRVQRVSEPSDPGLPQKATADKYSAPDRLKGESLQGPSSRTLHLQTSAAASAPDETKDSSSSVPMGKAWMEPNKVSTAKKKKN